MAIEEKTAPDDLDNIEQADSAPAISNSSIPPTNPVFKSAMGVVAFSILVLAVISLGTLFSLACLDLFGPVQNSNAFKDYIRPPKTELYWPWNAFVWLIASGGILAKIIALLAAILSIGIGVIAETTRNRWLAFLIIWLCLIGALLSVLLMWQLSGEPNLGILRSPTNLTDEQYLFRLNSVLVGFAIWFLAFLGRQIGLGGLELLKER